MAATDPNLGLTYGWTTGENGWGTAMDANLKLTATVTSFRPEPPAHGLAG